MMDMTAMYEQFGISRNVLDFGREIEEQLQSRFQEIDKTAEYNQMKVLKAMQDNRVSDVHFAATTGYGYNDLGRDTLEEVYALSLIHIWWGKLWTCIWRNQKDFTIWAIWLKETAGPRRRWRGNGREEEKIMAGLSPMMQHYVETKKQYHDCILFYRLGDFYEMFFEDAITVRCV